MVLFRDPAKFLWNAKTQQASELLHSGAAVLSGRGDVAWVLNAHALYRADLTTGRWETILDDLLGSVQLAGSGNVPGSTLWFTVSSPTAASLEIRTLDPALLLPIIPNEDPQKLADQIPWEFALTEGIRFEATVSRPNHPLELPFSLRISKSIYPELAIGRLAQLKAAQPDFTGLVLAESPAQPGTSIHAWIYGLGALERPIATGEPGPSDPPLRPVSQVSCTLDGHRTIEIPFLAYASHLLGVYQIDLTIPSDWPSGVARLDCQAEGKSTFAYLPIA